MSGMKITRLPVRLAGLLAIGLAVAGCRSEEQNRPLFFDKGTYQGQPDQELTDEQLDQLRQRARAQN